MIRKQYNLDFGTFMRGKHNKILTLQVIHINFCLLYTKKQYVYSVWFFFPQQHLRNKLYSNNPFNRGNLINAKCIFFF